MTTHIEMPRERSSTRLSILLQQFQFISGEQVARSLLSDRLSAKLAARILNNLGFKTTIETLNQESEIWLVIMDREKDALLRTVFDQLKTHHILWLYASCTRCNGEGYLGDEIICSLCEGFGIHP